MTPISTIETYITENYPDTEILLADGFEDAFIGVSYTAAGSPVAAYSRQKCIDILKKDMSEDEAIEFFDFNVSSAYMGENTPQFVDVFVREDASTVIYEHTETADNNNLYFAKDGSFGSAEGLLVVNGDSFTEQDWESIEDSPDNERLDTIRDIIENVDSNAFEL
jgi:hypothetical protein